MFVRKRARPIAFRGDPVTNAPRLQAALDLMREKSGWGSPLSRRCGRGVAVQASYATFVAIGVEREAKPGGAVKPRHVMGAVDASVLVNPNTVVAQLPGSLIFASVLVVAE